MIGWLEIITKWLLGLLRQRSCLMLENLALRHQLMVLKRNRSKPRFTESDRLFWVAYSKLIKRWQDFLEIASPRTVVDWNKKRFRRYWANKSRNRRPGRPCVSQEIQDLIRMMSQANPTWGTPRIIGELKKIGISVSKATVDRYRMKTKGSPSPTWKAFLTNEAKAMASIDFFTVPTATFRVLYVFVVLLHERRRVVHFNVTENPSGAWTTQQIVEAFPWDSAPKYLIRDNDRIYSKMFTNRINGMGIKEVKTAFQSPWQNPYCERLIGSIRRDCLDHLIIFNEQHLRSVLNSYFDYYHKSRCHLPLDQDSPEPRPIEPPDHGKVIAIPKAGGLHHLYTRKAS